VSLSVSESGCCCPTDSTRIKETLRDGHWSASAFSPRFRLHWAFLGSALLPIDRSLWWLEIRILITILYPVGIEPLQVVMCCGVSYCGIGCEHEVQIWEAETGQLRVTAKRRLTYSLGDKTGVISLNQFTANQPDCWWSSFSAEHSMWDSITSVFNSTYSLAREGFFRSTTEDGQENEVRLGGPHFLLQSTASFRFPSR
jgi:hypothetical protein